MSKKYDVFISYSRKDSEIVNRIVQILSAKGICSWMDKDGIESGDSFKTVIVSAIERSGVFLFFSSISSNSSEWTVKEVNLAIYKKKPIIPIRLDETEYNPSILFDLVGLDYIDILTEQIESSIESKLVKSIKKHLGVDKKTYLPEISYRFTEDKQLCTLFVNSNEFNFIKVISGVFTMGATKEMRNPTEVEFPTHEVRLSNDFYIGETLVTQKFWESVMGNNPSWFKGELRPVDSVSFNDVKWFIKRLNMWSNLKFRLPYEAEWEYAARGGVKASHTRYIGGDSVQDIGWYNGNSKKQSHEVKQKSPNELGLYDMGGNVWEWCQDLYSAYAAATQIDPKGPSTGTSRVVRGGSWSIGTRGCRASYRDKCVSGRRGYDLGFRLVLDLLDE